MFARQLACATRARNNVGFFRAAAPGEDGFVGGERPYGVARDDRVAVRTIRRCCGTRPGGPDAVPSAAARPFARPQTALHRRPPYCPAPYTRIIISRYGYDVRVMPAAIGLGKKF